MSWIVTKAPIFGLLVTFSWIDTLMNEWMNTVISWLISPINHLLYEKLIMNRWIIEWMNEWTNKMNERMISSLEFPFCTSCTFVNEKRDFIYSPPLQIQFSSIFGAALNVGVFLYTCWWCISKKKKKQRKKSPSSREFYLIISQSCLAAGDWGYWVHLGRGSNQWSLSYTHLKSPTRSTVSRTSASPSAFTFIVVVVGDDISTKCKSRSRIRNENHKSD